MKLFISMCACRSYTPSELRNIFFFGASEDHPSVVFPLHRIVRALTASIQLNRTCTRDENANENKMPPLATGPLGISPLLCTKCKGDNEKGGFPQNLQYLPSPPTLDPIMRLAGNRRRRMRGLVFLCVDARRGVRMPALKSRIK